MVGSPLRAGSGRDTIARPEVFRLFTPSDRFSINVLQTTVQSKNCQIRFQAFLKDFSHYHSNKRIYT